VKKPHQHNSFLIDHVEKLLETSKLATPGFHQ